MKKNTAIYFCTKCNTTYSKWVGKCTQCHSWNSVEESITPASFTTTSKSTKTKLVNFTDFTSTEADLVRYYTHINEFDRVCGSGIVPGSVLLIGGDPGVGKSTLLLQVIAKLSISYQCTYISGEESTKQLKSRAQRLGLTQINAKLASATSLKDILVSLTNSPPQVLIIDSIQTMYIEGIDSLPGSITQVRACALEIINFCKTNNVAAILVGHVTRDGQLAGPKVLEHMVDAVIHFEGENSKSFRILRTIKNRFGSSDEIGVFVMSEEGLIEISNPSSLFLSYNKENISGSAVFGGLEGSRAVLLEVQTLVAQSSFATPRRSVVGLDINRLYMLMALLETRYKISFNYKDVYASIAGGLRISEPAVDLALCASLISAIKEWPLPSNILFIGEVTLSGQIRNVPNLIKRLNEAHRLGFTKAYIPKNYLKSKVNNIPTKLSKEMEIIPLSNIYNLIQELNHVS